MKHQLKIWEKALILGLLVGLLGGSANADRTPVSRWQEKERPARYQVRLFPFGFAEAPQSAAVQVISPQEQGYKVGFKVMEWWEAVFG